MRSLASRLPMPRAEIAGFAVLLVECARAMDRHGAKPHTPLLKMGECGKKARAVGKE